MLLKRQQFLKQTHKFKLNYLLIYDIINIIINQSINQYSFIKGMPERRPKTHHPAAILMKKTTGL